jgi:hypothetical protein
MVKGKLWVVLKKWNSKAKKKNRKYLERAMIKLNKSNGIVMKIMYFLLLDCLQNREYP